MPVAGMEILQSCEVTTGRILESDEAIKISCTS